MRGRRANAIKATIIAMSREFIIYADESTQEGNYYSNFYGGALVRSRHLEKVRSTLQAVKEEQNLYSEIKWSKVTAQYLEKYRRVMDVFFGLVCEDQVKVRIMFTQNAHVPTGLSRYQRERTYHILYYQFVKHAFGLRFCDEGPPPIFLRIYLDRMPDTREKNAQFKAYLLGLQKSSGFRRIGIRMRNDQIAEVDSHRHDIIQCLDVVLGAMQFRLNDHHKLKPTGSRQRGKRTIAKEKLYRHIRQLICDMHPNFNIGISTGRQGDWHNLWRHSYRHWLFVPSDHELDSSKTKGA